MPFRNRVNWPSRLAAKLIGVAWGSSSHHVTLKHERLEAALEAGLEGTFPASDAVVRPFCAEPMRMWPISTRVNKPENDDPSVIEPVELSAATALRNR
jgi:hypothetical protein